MSRESRAAKQARINAQWAAIDGAQGTYAPSGAIGSRMYGAELSKAEERGKQKRREEKRKSASSRGLAKMRSKVPGDNRDQWGNGWESS